MVKMREGSWYRRRDGEVVGPCIPRDDELYPWNVGELLYSKEGNYWQDGPVEPEDLVEEVPAPDVAPSTTSTPIHGFPGDLRDWFAGMALSDAMSDSTLDAKGCERIAGMAYRMADAMMAQRNKEKAE